MNPILLVLTIWAMFAPLSSDYQPGNKIFVELQTLANKPLKEEMNDPVYEGDNLAELPQGRLKLEDGTEFEIGPKCVVLNGKHAPDRPVHVDGFNVREKITGLQILHACGWGAFGGKADPVGHYQEDGTLIGHYRVNYEDGDWEIIPIVYGRDVRDWWGVWDKLKPTTQAKYGWRGTNAHLKTRAEARPFPQPLRLFVTTWKNPKPTVRVVSIDMFSAKEVAAPFCVAITATTSQKAEQSDLKVKAIGDKLEQQDKKPTTEK
jgi:hypothetical protein